MSWISFYIRSKINSQTLKAACELQIFSNFKNHHRNLFSVVLRNYEAIQYFIKSKTYFPAVSIPFSLIWRRSLPVKWNFDLNEDLLGNSKGCIICSDQNLSCKSFNWRSNPASNQRNIPPDQRQLEFREKIVDVSHPPDRLLAFKISNRILDFFGSGLD